MKISIAITALGALAQETRLKIYRELVKAHSLEKQEGGLPVGALIKKLKVPPPTLSFHLKELHNAKLVSTRREGRSIIYKANLGTMEALVGHLLEDCCGGACGEVLTK
ncbi:MAG: winged helix-turn-helix transcriptional regulator [Gammaproteobacteria bacterium]|nr:winged helix-turn-helix transcriptional regulator [Gammaproteobacteria bacterium]